MGVVLNRRSEVTVDEAVPALTEIVDGDELVHVGGPVQPQAIVVLGEFEDPEHAGVLVFGTVGFLPGEVDDADELGATSHGRGCSPATRAGARASSRASSPSRPGSSSRRSPRTCSPPTRRRCGAPSCVARAGLHAALDDARRPVPELTVMPDARGGGRGPRRARARAGARPRRDPRLRRRCRQRRRDGGAHGCRGADRRPCRRRRPRPPAARLLGVERASTSATCSSTPTRRPAST